MRKKFRFLTILAICVMVLSCFSVTAFAYADDTEQNLPVTEATQPEQQPEGMLPVRRPLCICNGSLPCRSSEAQGD